MKNLVKNYGFWIVVGVILIGIFYGVQNLSRSTVSHDVIKHQHDESIHDGHHLFRQSPHEIIEHEKDGTHDFHDATPWGPISQLGQSGVSYTEMEPMLLMSRLRKIKQLRSSARCAPRSNVFDSSSRTFN